MSNGAREILLIAATMIGCSLVQVTILALLYGYVIP